MRLKSYQDRMPLHHVFTFQSNQRLLQQRMLPQMHQQACHPSRFSGMATPLCFRWHQLISKRLWTWKIQVFQDWSARSQTITDIITSRQFLQAYLNRAQNISSPSTSINAQASFPACSAPLSKACASSVHKTALCQSSKAVLTTGPSRFS